MFFALLGSVECPAYEGFVWNILSEYSLSFDFRNYLFLYTRNLFVPDSESTSYHTWEP